MLSWAYSSASSSWLLYLVPFVDQLVVLVVRRIHVEVLIDIHVDHHPMILVVVHARVVGLLAGFTGTSTSLVR